MKIENCHPIDSLHKKWRIKISHIVNFANEYHLLQQTVFIEENGGHKLFIQLKIQCVSLESEFGFLYEHILTKFKMYLSFSCEREDSMINGII